MERVDIFILGILLGSFLFYYINKNFRKIKSKKILKKAKKAEINAVDFLKKKGYEILNIQKKKTIVIYINNKPYESFVKADIIVKKGTKKYIVEVKTGNQTKVTIPHVRRQLLEYYLVYRPHGILLLDMERKQIKKVAFGKKYFFDNNWARYILAFGIGFFLCLLYNMVVE